MPGTKGNWANSMNRINPDIDIIADLLQAVIANRPQDEFCKSLLRQYRERGGLSKKQLEGLLGKASKFTNASAGKLATLEAIIRRKHTTHRSPAPLSIAADETDHEAEQMINDILLKYPQHKRVLFFKMKTEKKQPLAATEKDELIKFSKLLLKS